MQFGESLNKIAISQPMIDDRTEALVVGALRAGQLARGPLVDRLERTFERLTETSHAIAVSSGTTALELALEAVTQPGDTIITTPFTFVATLNAALRAGVRVRFADIGPDFNLDSEAVEAADPTGVTAIVPVHLYGLPAEMDRFEAVARSRGWRVVEDAAQAVGASFGGRPVGGFGVGCFSLYATKNVAAGEGGVITTDDTDLARAIRLIVNQGMERRYEYEVIGSNHRLAELAAAVALPQLDDLDDIGAARARNAAILTEGLDEVEWIITPRTSPKSVHVFHQYTIRIADAAPCSRQEFCDRLASAGVATGIYYPKVVFDYACFLDHPLVETAAVPNARRAAQQVVSIPVHPGLSEGDLERIITAVKGAAT